MANQAAFQSGWDTAANVLAERRARKQALSDEEFETHASRFADELASNRQILSTIDPQKNPQLYASKVQDLQRNLADIRELYHPDRHPNAVARFGHLITDKLGLTNEQTRIHKVAAKRAANAALDQGEAQELAAATPQQPNQFIDYRDALVKAGFTAEQAQKALEVRAGIEAKPTAAKPAHETDFDKGFARYLKEKGIDSADATAEDEAAYRQTIHPRQPSQYQSQRQAFAKSLGKSPAEMNWTDERSFLTERYGANQPFAQKRLALAEENQRIQQANLALRRSENNMKDYLSITKNLSPMEKIQTTAERAEELVNDPSGPGDVSLTFAFIDATKPGTGFRFTDAERRWLTTGTRGVMEGALTRINQGFTGETLSPEQRQHMAAIIKQAASQAYQQRASILGATGQINPTAAALAGGNPPSTSPGELKKRAKSNLDQGISDDDFLKKVR
jgi:hypothetical protein